MIRYLVARSVAAMKKRFDYDGSYLLEVAEVSSGAAMRLGLLPLFSQYHAAAPATAWAGVALASTRDGDCGPCLQLIVNMAIKQGVDPEAIRAALQGSFDEAGEVGLGYRFGTAAINDGPDLDALRDQLLQRYGQEAVISLSIAAATGRTWPVIKRGLGHGRTCQAVTVNDAQMNLAAATTATA